MQASAFVDATIARDFTAAQEVFAGAMKEKVQDALDARKVAVAQQMYSGAPKE